MDIKMLLLQTLKSYGKTPTLDVNAFKAAFKEAKTPADPLFIRALQSSGTATPLKVVKEIFKEENSLSQSETNFLIKHGTDNDLLKIKKREQYQAFQEKRFATLKKRYESNQQKRQAMLAKAFGTNSQGVANMTLIDNTSRIMDEKDFKRLNEVQRRDYLRKLENLAKRSEIDPQKPFKGQVIDTREQSGDSLFKWGMLDIYGNQMVSKNQVYSEELTLKNFRRLEREFKDKFGSSTRLYDRGEGNRVSQRIQARKSGRLTVKLPKNKVGKDNTKKAFSFTPLVKKVI